MKIERFEDLKVWQYSRTLVTDVYTLQITNFMQRILD